MDWPQLREEVRVAAARVGGLLRAFPDGSVPLARVTWSVAETGAHLVGLPGRYLRMASAPTPFPVSLAEENQREIDAVADREPASLADALESEVAALLAHCRTLISGSGTSPSSTPHMACARACSANCCCTAPTSRVRSAVPG
ncbi:hypothetical protein ABZX92_41860 [Lentzea sp. NPDC006480]|uniref:hypothetical protein n=1 Tax=Lentzea sp. NPDC006480 TaxID=3157176 RepID=UPI0033A97A7C